MKPKSHFRSISYLDHNEEVYDKLLTDLQSRLESEKSSVPQDHFFFSTPKDIPNKQLYAEALKRQIEEKNKSKALERIEIKSHANSVAHHGYPNLPDTPREEKRKKNLESMLKLKTTLEQQMMYKNCVENDSKHKEFELDQRIKEENLSKLAKEASQKQEKKMKQKEILVESWNLALQAKNLQKQLEDINRKGASVKRERNEEKVIKKNTSEVGQLLVDFQEQDSKPIPVSKTKAPKLKKPLPIKGYQAKIKKIIGAAKQLRGDTLRFFPRHASP